MKYNDQDPYVQLNRISMNWTKKAINYNIIYFAFKNESSDYMFEI
jgi:hypothetical protein